MFFNTSNTNTNNVQDVLLRYSFSSQNRINSDIMKLVYCRYNMQFHYV